MPILYACVINRSRTIVLDGKDKRFKANFQTIVQESQLHFESYAQKYLELDDETTLHYIDKGSWALVAISRKPDVTLYEAMNFLEKFEETLTDPEQGFFSNITLIQTPNAQQQFSGYCKNVNKLIQQWNEDPKNRDRVYVVFQELMKAKEEMLENMNLLHDRDQLLEEGLVKAEGLSKSAKVYKNNAKKAEKTFDRRRCCCWFMSVSTIIVVAVGIFLILWLWLGVIKF